MSYKKIDLIKISNTVGYDSWIEILDAVNKETGFIVASDFEKTSIDHKYVKHEKRIFSNKNYVFANKIIDSNKKVIDIDKLNLIIKDKEIYFMYHDQKYRLSSLSAYFLCPNCDREYVQDLNPSRSWSRRTPLCRKCQKSILHKCSDYQENYKASLMKNHGVDSPIKDEKIRQKIRNTMKERYGVEYTMQSKDLCEKHALSMMKNWGRENFFSKINQWIEFGFSKRDRGYISVLEQDVVGYIHELLPNDKIYSYKTRRFVKRINDICFVPDVYIPSHNLVIEVNGDFWHANPDVFDEKRVFISGLTMEQIHERDRCRQALLENELCCRFFVIWENDWNNTKDIVKQKIKEIICEQSNIIHGKEEICLL